MLRRGRPLVATPIPRVGDNLSPQLPRMSASTSGSYQKTSKNGSENCIDNQVEGFDMTMVIRDKRGVRVSAVLLAASRQQMRVAVKSEIDTVELNCVDGCWYDESGAPVEIEAMAPVPETDFAGFCAQVYPFDERGWATRRLLSLVPPYVKRIARLAILFLPLVLPISYEAGPARARRPTGKGTGGNEMTRYQRPDEHGSARHPNLALRFGESSGRWVAAGCAGTGRYRTTGDTDPEGKFGCPCAVASHYRRDQRNVAHHAPCQVMSIAGFQQVATPFRYASGNCRVVL